MLQKLQEAITPSKGRSLAGAFFRLGWAGFWLQVVFGALPILGMGCYLIFNPDAERGLGFFEWLAILNLLILIFTAFWSYRYVQIGRRLREPERSPSETTLIRMVWTGVVAVTAGMLVSMIAIVIETAKLLFYFMRLPQAGMRVIQTSDVGVVSSIDILSLMALVLFLFAELIVLVFSLWLLFRTTLGVPETPPSAVPA
jgi:hypothetical protein